MSISRNIVLGIFIIVLWGVRAYTQQDVPLCYELIWHDEFNGDEVDESKWSYQNGTWNGANVQNCYVPENTSVSDGTLKIIAKYEPGFQCFNQTRDFTSGFIQNRNVVDWTYGYFEARLKVPASNSTWPAFWMSPQDDVYGQWPRSGEIDILEIRGHDMTTTTGNAHWGNGVNDRVQQKGPLYIGDASDWHVYGVEWSLGELKFYVDGVHYHTIDNFREPNAASNPAPFDQGFYMRLNMAVGGNFLREPWNDAMNGIDQLPATMEVDYVRVYQLDDQCTSRDNCSLISNGGFESNTSDWILWTANGSDGQLSVNRDGFVEVDITSTGSTDWQLGLRQTGLDLINGKSYEVSYVAYADADRSSNVIVSRSNGSQYHVKNQPLTTLPTVYSWTFTMNSATDLDAVINFGVGSDATTAYFENVRVVEVGCEPCQYNMRLLDHDIRSGAYRAENEIISDGRISDMMQVGLRADRVLLLPEFSAELGAILEVDADPCRN